MRIKEVTKQTGLTERTIRYYESRELIAPITELRNGKVFRDYSESDVNELNAVASLRRSLFSIEQIRRMKEEPEDIIREFERYKAWLYAEKEGLQRLIRAAEAVDPTRISDIYELAHEMSYVSQDLPLPTRDVKPNFGRFDEETPQQRAEAYLRFERWYRFHRLKALIPIGAAILILVIATAIAFAVRRTEYEYSLDVDDRFSVISGISGAQVDLSLPVDGLSGEALADQYYGEIRRTLSGNQKNKDCAAALVDSHGNILVETGNALIFQAVAGEDVSLADTHMKDDELFYKIDGEFEKAKYYAIDLDSALPQKDLSQFTRQASIFSSYEEYSSAMDMLGQSMVVYGGISGTRVTPDYLGFYDFETNTASFDSDEFISFIEFCKENRDSTDDEIQVRVASVWDFMEAQVGRDCFGKAIKYMGFPTLDGKSSGNYINNQNDYLAINSASQNKEGAWEFMRVFLSESFQQEKYCGDRTNAFPTNINALNTLAQQSMAKLYVNETEETSRGQYDYQYQPASQEEVDTVMALIDSLKETQRMDMTIYEIVSEELTAFLGGDTDAQSAAKVIQNRVETYISERS